MSEQLTIFNEQSPQAIADEAPKKNKEQMQLGDPRIWPIVEQMIADAIANGTHSTEHDSVCSSCNQLRPAFMGIIGTRRVLCEECYTSQQTSAGLNEMMEKLKHERTKDHA